MFDNTLIKSEKCASIDRFDVSHVITDQNGNGDLHFASTFVHISPRLPFRIANEFIKKQFPCRLNSNPQFFLTLSAKLPVDTCWSLPNIS